MDIVPFSQLHVVTTQTEPDSDHSASLYDPSQSPIPPVNKRPDSLATEQQKIQDKACY